MFNFLFIKRVKDLTNLKEKLEAQINEKDETIATLKKRINGLVSISLTLSVQVKLNTAEH